MRICLSDFYSVSLSLLALFFSFVPWLSSLPHASVFNPIMHRVQLSTALTRNLEVCLSVCAAPTLHPRSGGLRMRSCTERPHQTVSRLTSDCFMTPAIIAVVSGGHFPRGYLLICHGGRTGTTNILQNTFFTSHCANLN